MSRTYRSLSTISHGTKQNRWRPKFDRKAEFIPKGFSKHMKVSGGWFGHEGWINTNHIRGLLRKYLGKPYDDFYSEFCELYRNTTWFSNKDFLIDIFKPIVVPEYRFPAVKLHISLNRFGDQIVDEIEYLGYDKVFPESIEYESGTRYGRSRTYSLKDLSKQYRGAFYLNNGIINYVKHIPFKHVPYDPYRIGQACRVRCKEGIYKTLYIVDKDIKPYVKSASELWSEKWHKELEERKKRKPAEPAEYIQCGTKMVEYYDLDEDLNEIPILVEEPRFKRKKTYRYNREYLTKKERQALHKTEKK